MNEPRNQNANEPHDGSFPGMLSPSTRRFILWTGLLQFAALTYNQFFLPSPINLPIPDAELYLLVPVMITPWIMMVTVQQWHQKRFWLQSIIVCLLVLFLNSTASGLPWLDLNSERTFSPLLLWLPLAVFLATCLQYGLIRNEYGKTPSLSVLIWQNSLMLGALLLSTLLALLIPYLVFHYYYSTGRDILGTYMSVLSGFICSPALGFLLAKVIILIREKQPLSQTVQHLTLKARNRFYGH